MIASFSGILVTILVLGILIAIHESGHFLAAKSIKVPVRQFAIGFGPRIVGFTWGETECRLNWIPLGGYCAFVDDEEDADAAADPTAPAAAPEMLLRNRPIWQRTWVVSAGVIFNFLSAWLILFGSNLAQGVPTGHQLVGVNKVVPASAAEKAGLLPGDRIESVAGQKFDGFDGFKTILGNKKDQPVEIAVARGGQTVTLTATPDKDGRLGFQPSIKDERRAASGLGEAITVANSEQVRYTVMLTGALAQLFSAPGENMSKTGGPVAIVAMGDQVYQTDPWKLLEFAVILSIELAVINLLPLPALDGGHLVLLALEKIRRRPLPREMEQKVMAFGFLLIMGLGMLLIGKDLINLPTMYGPRPAAPSPAVASPK